MHFSGAHNDLVIIRKGEVIKLKACRQPVGFYEHQKAFECATFQMMKGDHVYLSTDGFADQFGGDKGKKFKSVNFEKLVLSISSLPIAEQKTRLSAEFEAWKGEFEQLDDICVIGFQV